jgi:hypothetical protein
MPSKMAWMLWLGQIGMKSRLAPLLLPRVQEFVLDGEGFVLYNRRRQLRNFERGDFWTKK